MHNKYDHRGLLHFLGSKMETNGSHFPILENATADKAIGVELHTTENDLEAFFRIANRKPETGDNVLSS